MSVKKNLHLSPSEKQARKRRLFFIRSYIILFFLSVIIFGLAILSSHEKVIVKTIIVSGEAAVSTDNVLEIANRDMAGRYWHLFARNNFLIFPRWKIKADLLREIKTIKDVNISWKGWQIISIMLEERKPQAVYCGTDPLKVEAQCFFMDKDGYIFSQAPVFSGNLFVRNYSSLVGVDQIGQYFLSQTDYNQILDLLELFNQKDLRIVKVFFDGFDFRFILEIGPTIIFKADESFTSALDNLFTAIGTGDLDLISDSANINYVDLRFDSKIVIGKK